MLWRAEEHERLTDRDWDAEAARVALESIVTDAEAAERDGYWPGHPQDDVAKDERFCSLYLGAAGMLWALWKLGSSRDVRTAIATALERYRASPDLGAEAHPPSLLLGETGLLLVAERVGSPAADRQRLEELVRRNRAHPTWELLWGSPGTMLAARACGLQEAWADSGKALWAARDEASGLWTQDMYGQVTQYLGAGHGFVGNAHALRGFVEDDVLRTCVSEVLERTALRQDGLVNWPPIMDASPSEVRVQWCHGAPGVLSAVGDLIPGELSLPAGELIWRAGPLRKGSGLCHGTAGNAFALLKLHALTGDERWLERARRFAMHAAGQVERMRAELGRGRYTLWTGDVGVALLLQACLEGQGWFPTFECF